MIVDPVCDMFQALIVCDCRSSGTPPGIEVLLQVFPIQQTCLYIAEFCDLSVPVDHDRSRADHQEAHTIRGACIFQMHHSCDRLYGLPQSHLIAQQYMLLMKNILYAKSLVSSQVSSEAVQHQFLFADLRCQLSRDTSVDLLLVLLRRDQFFQQHIVGGAVSLIIGESILVADGYRFQIQRIKTLDTGERRALTVCLQFPPCIRRFLFCGGA